MEKKEWKNWPCLIVSDGQSLVQFVSDNRDEREIAEKIKNKFSWPIVREAVREWGKSDGWFLGTGQIPYGEWHIYRHGESDTAEEAAEKIAKFMDQ